MDFAHPLASLLESLQNLTGADSVNLCLIDPYKQTAFEPYILGETLVDFQSPLGFPAFRESHDHAFFCHGNQPNSVLIGFQESSSKATLTHPRNRKTEPAQRPLMWLGLCFAEAPPVWLHEISQPLAQIQQRDARTLAHLLSLAASQCYQLQSQDSALVDALTNMPSRTRFQTQLAELLSRYPNAAVLMVHTAEFQQINRKFGHAAGDQVISEIAANLRDCLREDDLMSRFGGALFALAVPINEQQQALHLARKIQAHLQQPAYLNSAVILEFDFGIGCVSQEDQFELVSERISTILDRADQALKLAQAEARPTITLWQPSHIDLFSQQPDYIGGIFSADTSTDYRNMLLLWDISNLIASENQFNALLQGVLKRLAKTFTYQFAGIIDLENEGTQIYEFDHQLTRCDELPNDFENLLTRCQQEALVEGRPTLLQEEQFQVFFTPFIGHKRSGLFICSQIQALELTHSIEQLLAALTRQVGRALNRIQLEQQLNSQLVEKQQQLQSEVEQLRTELQGTHLLYRSEAMQHLMRLAKRAALTDTTTLIIGESGTGKERLVHSLHKMGSRKDKPLVIVDCGAIPETLIESELFGHTKGAFTGASSSQRGKIMEATSGTLVLDEIGELPLQMQTKLLRLVQEKEFTPVGATKSQRVDIKIIAVTNRELTEEVAAGRFRQDLFYRLNVLTLRPPALRDRLDDIPLLSRHFLKKFSQQFNEPEKHLSQQARHRMLQYHWPGNVRELENCLMQAHLLTEGDNIEWHDLNVQHQSATELEVSATEAPPSTVRASDAIPTMVDMPTHSAPAVTVSPSSAHTHSHSDLSRALDDVIQSALESAQYWLTPLGTWLEQTLYWHLRDLPAGQVGLRLGVSLSTVRRKLALLPPALPDHPQWQPVVAVLKAYCDDQAGYPKDLLTLCRNELLRRLLQATGNQITQSAALMDVTEPTLYKWRRSLAEC